MCNMHPDASTVRPAHTVPTHFTLTGQYAGTPVCGADRHSDGVNYAHIPYGVPTDEFRARICPWCYTLAYGDNAMADGVFDFLNTTEPNTYRLTVDPWYFLPTPSDAPTLGI